MVEIDKNNCHRRINRSISFSTMKINGQNFIGNSHSGLGTGFQAVNPSTGAEIDGIFFEATLEEIDLAIQKAETAFEVYRHKSGEEKALFLEAIAEEIMALGDALIERCQEETGLPEGRFIGERGRTVNQLKLFASLLREGSWVGARIDHGDPGRTPVPKPDIRQLQIPLGPVGIFGASNFPLAFSVAGGDTASALAAGCSIMVKAHPAHPGVCDLVAQAIQKAVEKTAMPDGVFSMVHGKSVDVGQSIVKHPLIKAIGFTGSYRGGKAIFDSAAQRAEPIPVFAEMGSTNPVFILPGALKEHASAIAKGLATSVTLGVGQFCTNPGLVLVEEGEEGSHFLEMAGEELGSLSSSVMLTEGIQKAYEKGLVAALEKEEVQLAAQGKIEGTGYQGQSHLLHTNAKSFLNSPDLEEEIFGPSTILIEGQRSELLEIAKNLKGHLTATVWASETELKENSALLHILERKVGRLLINGFPTGVEVCHAMVHGGPFPATTDARSTSVGTGAIQRFTRPICYQNYPNHLLPPALMEANPLKIWRLVDGEMTQ